MAAAKQYDIVALTAICVDIRIESTDEALKEYGVVKGDSTVVGADIFKKILTGHENDRAAGSAGGNVAAGIALRGGQSAIIGKIANDANGAFFAKRVAQNDIHYEPVYSANKSTATTAVAALITPDKERSFAFLPGAGAELTPEEVEGQRGLIANAKITYLDSYLWLSESGKAAVHHATDLARESGSRVAVALNSASVVAQNQAGFLALIKKGDILVGDKQEFANLLGMETFEETKALDALRKLGVTASITAGAAGAFVFDGGEHSKLEFVPSLKIPKEKIADTNGAGDQFAAGFIYGLANGKNVVEAGKQATTWAAAVIQHAGAEPRVGKNALPTAKLSAAVAPKRRIA
jgi:sugar/nucleoside kinase (ribokinase family)